MNRTKLFFVRILFMTFPLFPLDLFLLGQADMDDALSTVDAVLEAGGDITKPPAVSPFPNWAEDSDEMVGSRVRVYWDGDNEWYSGRIVRFKATQPKPYLVRCVCVCVCWLVFAERTSTSVFTYCGGKDKSTYDTCSLVESRSSRAFVLGTPITAAVVGATFSGATSSGKNWRNNQ